MTERPQHHFTPLVTERNANTIHTGKLRLTEKKLTPREARHEILFPGILVQPFIYEEKEVELPKDNKRIAIKARTTEADVKDFWYSDTFDFNLANKEDNTRARAMIAYYKVDFGMDVCLGPAISEGTNKKENELVLDVSGGKVGLYVEKDLWIIAGFMTAMNPPWFETGEVPEDREYQKSFMQAFIKARKLVPHPNRLNAQS